MFSSNQELKISGNLDTLSVERALKFCIDVAGYGSHAYTLIWQTLETGEFCIGVQYGDETAPQGWNSFLISDDLDIVALSIIKFLDRQEFPRECGGDGSNNKGFLVKQITYKDEGYIENWMRGIVKFSPFTCFYHK